MDANLQSYSLVLHQDADPRTGGVAVCGFTTAGMVGVISASHIIKTLGLQQLGTVMHKDFPAVALIHDEVPKHPVRVYQGENIGVFTSEIQFGNETDIMFASTVLEWFTKGGFDRLIIIDGITRPEKELSTGDLFGVGSISPLETVSSNLTSNPSSKASYQASRDSCSVKATDSISTSQPCCRRPARCIQTLEPQRLPWRRWAI